MAFFKKYNGTQDRRLLVLERSTWVCIYGGLLTLVLGYFVGQQGASNSLYLRGGSIAVLLGLVQIYIRSRMQEK